MVTMYRCGLVGAVVRRYIHVDILTIIINFPYSTCIASLLLCSFKKCFSGPYIYSIYMYLLCKLCCEETVAKKLYGRKCTRLGHNVSLWEGGEGGREGRRGRREGRIGEGRVREEGEGNGG